MGKILVIDDNDRHVDIMCAMLDAAGLTTEPCLSGAGAIEKLAHTRYDAVMLDLLMPDIDGFDILDAMSGSANARTPVIIVTANIDLARRDLAGRAQVKTMLEKPVRTGELLTAAYLALAPRTSAHRLDPVAASAS